MRRIVLIIGLVLALGTSDAYAFFDPPWITPTAPQAGDTVSANFRMGICDARVEEPGFPQLTRTGNAIRLTVYGVHEDTAELCVYPTAAGSEPVGAFEPGNYTLTVEFAYDDYLFGPTIINLGVIAFTVTGTANAEPVPSLDRFSGVTLLLLTAGVAASHLRHRVTS